VRTREPTIAGRRLLGSAAVCVGRPRALIACAARAQRWRRRVVHALFRRQQHLRRSGVACGASAGTTVGEPLTMCAASLRLHRHSGFAFCTRSACSPARLLKERVSSMRRVYETDGTMGLVMQLLAAADRLRLRRLHRVYVSLPLEEAARLAGLASPAEAERLVAAMVRAAAACAHCYWRLPTGGVCSVALVARHPCMVTKRALPPLLRFSAAMRLSVGRQSVSSSTHDAKGLRGQLPEQWLTLVFSAKAARACAGTTRPRIFLCACRALRMELE
jgi:hypothetical protein